jgi:hypothetical protein
MANIYGLKIAESKARCALYDAAGVATVRSAIEILGESHPAVQAFNRITKSIDNHMKANPAGLKAMATGYRGMRVE